MVRLCLTFLLLAAVGNAADLTVLVTKQAANHPVPNAEVTLENPDTSQRHREQTDPDGLASFTDIPAGHYLVEVTASSYEPAYQEFDLAPAEVRRLEITDLEDPVKVELALNPMIPAAERGAFSLRLILHGRRVCSARNPNCGDCVLADFCPSAGVA